MFSRSSLLYDIVFGMEVEAPQVESQEDSRIRLYRRLLFCVDGNKSVGAQISTINDKLYVGIGKFWRTDGWKPNRWAPGKKGSHIFLTVEQFRALVTASPQISNAAQIVEDLIQIGTNEFEDISESRAAVTNAGSGTAVSGTEPTSLSTENVSTTAAKPTDELTSGIRGADACDGELRKPSTSQGKDQKAQDISSTACKRKRGRPSNVSGQEGATPKTSKSKTRKTDSATATNTAAAVIVLEHDAPADPVVLEHGTSPV